MNLKKITTPPKEKTKQNKLAINDTHTRRSSSQWTVCSWWFACLMRKKNGSVDSEGLDGPDSPEVPL